MIVAGENSVILMKVCEKRRVMETTQGYGAKEIYLLVLI